MTTKENPVSTDQSGRVVSTGVPVDPVLEEIARQSISEKEQAQKDAEKAVEEEIEAEQETVENEWLQALDHAKELLCSALPEAEPVWSKKRMENLAAALARCDQAYGWGGMAGIFGHPLVGLAFAGFPLAIGTAKVINNARAKKPVDVEANPVKNGDETMAGSAQ